MCGMSCLPNCVTQFSTVRQVSEICISCKFMWHLIYDVLLYTKQEMSISNGIHVMCNENANKRTTHNNTSSYYDSNPIPGHRHFWQRTPLITRYVVPLCRAEARGLATASHNIHHALQGDYSCSPATDEHGGE